MAHAHPAPEDLANDIPQRAQQMFADIALNVTLAGLPGAEKPKTTDIYCPEVRRGTFSVERPVNHLDVVSCWKALSYHQADELAFWNSCFRNALETQMADILRIVLAQHWQEAYNASEEISIIQCLCECLAAGSLRRVNVDIRRLVHDMISLYFEDYTVTNRLRWFASTGDMPSAVYNFLRTRDCFEDTFPRPSLRLAFTYDCLDKELRICGHVEWHPPNIELQKLPILLKPGQEYRIEPLYHEADLGSACGPRFLRFPEEIEYVVSSEHLPLTWDRDRCLFYAQVPTFNVELLRKKADVKPQAFAQGDEAIHAPSQVSSNPRHSYPIKQGDCETETTFCATIVMPFPDSVRFERTTRYSIKLGILKPSEPVDTQRTYIDSRYVTTSREEEMEDFPSAEQLLRAKTAVDVTRTPQHERPWVPSYSSTPMSKRGAKIVDTHTSSAQDYSSPESSSVERATRVIRQGVPKWRLNSENGRLSETEKDESTNKDSMPTPPPWITGRLKHNSKDQVDQRQKDVCRAFWRRFLRPASISPQLPTQKRKATRQLPLSSMFENSVKLEAERHAPEDIEYRILEFAKKRQRLDERIASNGDLFNQPSRQSDCGSPWRDEAADIAPSHVDHAVVSSPSRMTAWSDDLTDGASAREAFPSPSCSEAHAYDVYIECCPSSQAMPSPRKKSSAQRTNLSLHKRSASKSAIVLPYPTPEHSAASQSESDSQSQPDEEMDQVQIICNFHEFEEKRIEKDKSKGQGNKSEASEEDREAFETIFLGADEEVDDGSEWNDVSDLSAGFEGVALGRGN